MTVRHDSKTHEAEAIAWVNYCANITSDYREQRAGSRSKDGHGYVDPSPQSRAAGAAWLAAYRERELHCRRRMGA